jgi:uncharacterized hydrophobic protein (TIGR00271 family)
MMTNSQDVNTDSPNPATMPAVALVVDQQDHFLPLLSIGAINAKAHHGTLHVFLISFSNEKPTWPILPPEYEDAGIVLKSITEQKAINTLLKELRVLKPLLVGLAMSDESGANRYFAGKEFEPVLQQLKCPVFIVKSEPGWVFREDDSAFVPFWDDNNTQFAIATALNLAPNLKITAAKVLNPSVHSEELQMQEEEFAIQTKQWLKLSRFSTKVLFNFNEENALREEADTYGFVLIGASRGNHLARALFGDYRSRLAKQVKRPVIILREPQGKAGIALFKGWSFLDKLLPTLTREDRIEAYRQIRRAGRPTRDFYSMIALSAGIASLGLILNSSAVIIGAMLVAPLMSAITGMGMAIIQGDLRFLLLTFKGVLRGAAMAIATGVILGFINFRGEITQEMLSRTEPSSLDLFVALVSGIAAAYALSRKNVSNSLPGVAIAVALVPPLATAGVSVSVGSWGMAYGALTLFLSNMVAIVFASAVVFASLGFRPNIDTTKDHRRLTVFRRSFIASGILVVVMFSLLITQTVEEVQEYSVFEKVQYELNHHLQDRGIVADISDWGIATDPEGIFKINLLMRSSKNIDSEEVGALKEKLERILKKKVVLDVAVIPIDLIHAE